jgi:hypothetical protein
MATGSKPRVEKLTNAQAVERYFYPPEPLDLVSALETPEAVEAIKAALGRIVHDDFEVIRTDRGIWSKFGGHFRGVDEWVSEYHGETRVWNAFVVVLDSLIELDERRILALVRMECRTATGDVEINQPSGCIFTFEGGKVLRLEEFMTRIEAVEAAGLDPGDPRLAAASSD